MVRFIMTMDEIQATRSIRFTFQYGQIYYVVTMTDKQARGKIYIPIWLDLLYIYILFNLGVLLNLHSNMVRFIMNDFTF